MRASAIAHVHVASAIAPVHVEAQRSREITVELDCCLSPRLRPAGLGILIQWIQSSPKCRRPLPPSGNDGKRIRLDRGGPCRIRTLVAAPPTTNPTLWPLARRRSCAFCRGGQLTCWPFGTGLGRGRRRRSRRMYTYGAWIRGGAREV